IRSECSTSDIIALYRGSKICNGNSVCGKNTVSGSGKSGTCIVVLAMVLFLSPAKSVLARCTDLFSYWHCCSNFGVARDVHQDPNSHAIDHKGTSAVTDQGQGQTLRGQ